MTHPLSWWGRAAGDVRHHRLAHFTDKAGRFLLGHPPDFSDQHHSIRPLVLLEHPQGIDE
jgi:hypothetical protein